MKCSKCKLTLCGCEHQQKHHTYFCHNSCMNMYTKLTEHNDWEGETWHFFLPMDKNEQMIIKLREHILKEDPSGENYTVSGNLLTEAEVDTLVKHGNGNGYMDTFNKLHGEFYKLPKISGDDDELYKGGIQGFFRPWKKPASPS